MNYDNKLLVFVILVSIFYGSCGNGNDNSAVEKLYFQNGGVKFICELNKESNRNGKGQEFFQTGELRSESNWKNGILHGAYVEYFINGQVDYETEFQNGKKCNFKKVY